MPQTTKGYIRSQADTHFKAEKPKTTPARRVLPDLTSKYSKQAQEAEIAAKTGKAVTQHTGSPYDDGAIHSYVSTKGRNMGKTQFVLRFQHKANPVWSRQFDLTDLELLSTLSEADLKAIVAVLKSKKV